MENFHHKNFNSSWPSDTIWRHRSWSPLAQVMACYLMAPIHCLKQCRLIISKAHWCLSKQLYQRYTSHQSWKSSSTCFNQISFKSPKGQWVKILSKWWMNTSYVSSQASHKPGYRFTLPNAYSPTKAYFTERSGEILRNICGHCICKMIQLMGWK